MPLANAVYVRMIAPNKVGEHLLDAQAYHHTGANVLRCVALSTRGGRYEGDVTVLDEGAMQLDPYGYETERGVTCLVRDPRRRVGPVVSNAVAPPHQRASRGSQARPHRRPSQARGRT